MDCDWDKEDEEVDYYSSKNGRSDSKEDDVGSGGKWKIPATNNVCKRQDFGFGTSYVCDNKD